MIEQQDIIHRLRLGQSVKVIHRETGRNKTVVRTLKALAQREGWLESGRGLPAEGEIQRLYERARQIMRVNTHPLEL